MPFRQLLAKTKFVNNSSDEKLNDSEDSIGNNGVTCGGQSFSFDKSDLAESSLDKSEKSLDNDDDDEMSTITYILS